MSSANPVHIRTICILDTFLVWQSYFYESFFIWGKHITCARRMRKIIWIQSIPASMNHMREIQRPYTKFLYSDLFYFIFSFKLICCFQRILIFFLCSVSRLLLNFGVFLGSTIFRASMNVWCAYVKMYEQRMRAR